MSISEYEFFGVSSHANEKNTRYTDGKRIPTVGKQEEETSEEERFVDMVRETEVKSVALCVLSLLAGLCCEESAEYKEAEVELVPLPASNIDWENVA